MNVLFISKEDKLVDARVQLDRDDYDDDQPRVRIGKQGNKESCSRWSLCDAIGSHCERKCVA